MNTALQYIFNEKNKDSFLYLIPIYPLFKLFGITVMTQYKYSFLVVIIHLLILQVAFSLGGCQENSTNDRLRLGLVGNIRTLKEISYDAMDTLGTISPGKRSRPSWKKDTYRVFNIDGNLIQEIQYKTDGEVRNKIYNKFHSMENKVEEFTFKPDNILLYKRIAYYTQAGKPIEKFLYGADDSLLSKWIYKYNDQGYKIEENQYFPPNEKPSIRTLFKYNSKGNKVVEEMFNPEGGLIARWISKYNSKNLPAEESYFYSDGSLNSKENYSYEFDKNGNWVRQIIKEGGTPRYIIIREIVYYDN